MRKDYVSERFMIVGKKADKISDPKKSPYAPGNESMTNPSVLSLVEKSGMLQRLQDAEDDYVTNWSIRVFESKTPTVSINSENTYSDGPHYSEPAYGFHYIVVASPKEKESFSTIDIEQWSNVLVVVQDRLRWLYTQKGVTYVSIYANQGEAAGSDNPHPHLNIVTFQLFLQSLKQRLKLHTKFLTKRAYVHYAKPLM